MVVFRIYLYVNKIMITYFVLPTFPPKHKMLQEIHVLHYDTEFNVLFSEDTQEHFTVHITLHFFQQHP
jgi:hypothetical protein